MKMCEDCKRYFPDYLINKMTIFTQETGLIYPDVCPLCALKRSNEIHGLKRTKFGGTVAQKNLERAIKFLKEQSL